MYTHRNTVMCIPKNVVIGNKLNDIIAYDANSTFIAVCIYITGNRLR